jgi:hypothetical protein
VISIAVIGINTSNFQLFSVLSCFSKKAKYYLILPITEIGMFHISKQGDLTETNLEYLGDKTS